MAIRGKKNKEDSPMPGWEIVYTGFVLILLCFFIMLCSFSSMKEVKVMKFVRSFVDTLSIMPGGADFQPGKVVLPESPDMVNVKSGIAQIYQDMKELVEELGLEQAVELALSEKGLMMVLSDNILFDPGVTEISSQGTPFLKKVRSIIGRTAFDVRIEGHTDNIPIHTWRYPSNWDLSTARAVNVLRYFLKDEKIASERLSAVGCGEFQPLFPNDSPEHRTKNRRVEIIFVNE